MTLKPNTSKQFGELLEQKVVPALRKESGFQERLDRFLKAIPEPLARCQRRRASPL